MTLPALAAHRRRRWRPRPGPPARLAAAAVIAAASLLLAGCQAVPRIAAVAAGGIAGAATSSPAVGFAVGVATDAAGIAAVRHLGRRWGREEQDAIAEAAGRLRAGEWGGWRVSRPFPFRDGRGEVRVVGSIENPLAPCKEFLFSAAEADGEDGLAAASPRRWHAAAVCLQADGSWGWASAEPAVGRWGYLH